MKEKGIKILFSIFLLASILMPFSVSSETVGGSSPIIGVNITYIGYDGEVVPYQTTVRFDTEQTMWRCTSSHSTMGCQVWESEDISGSTLDEITGTITTNATSTYTYRLYQYEFIFDKTYVGTITFNGNHPGATTTTTYYVNGNRLVLTDINLVTSFTIGSYNLTYAPLEIIDMTRQYNFPIESFGFIYPLLINNRFNLVDIQPYNYYSFPIFKLTNNTEIYTKYINNNFNTVHIVFGTVAEYEFNGLLNGFRFSMGDYNIQWSDIKNYKAISRNQYSTTAVPYISNIVSFDIVIPSSVTNRNLKITSLNTYYFMPVYFSERNYISTDFALQFGLSNELLDNLNIIAQGTQQSQQAGEDLDDATSDMQSDFNSYYSIENTANSDFNSALNGINFNDQIAGNQSFLDSASFVKTVFSSMMQIPILSTFVIILCIILMARIFL